MLLDLNAWGSWASIIGLILTLIGFGITFYGVWKTKNAAQQANNAVSQVKNELVKLNTISDISTAISQLEGIKSLHQEGNSWRLLPEKYAAIKKILISIREMNPNLSRKQKSKIQAAITNLTSIQNDIEKCNLSKTEPTNVSDMNAALTANIDDLFAGSVLI